MTQKLNEAQLKFVREHAEEFWQAFVADDVDLPTSRCACCDSRRELLRKVEELGKVVA